LVTKPRVLHKQRCAASRECARTPHGPALSPVISGQGHSPNARPRRPPPPRQPITATPPICPVLDRKADTEAAHLRLQHGATHFKAARRATTPRAECRSKANSRAEHWGFPRAPRAQDKAPRQEEIKSVSRAARNKRKQPAFASKCDAHRTCRSGGIAEHDERLAVFVLQNNSTAEKGVRGGSRSQGKQRSAAPPVSQVRQGGPRGNAPPRYVNHAHNTPAQELGKQRRQPRCACAGQTKSNRKSEQHFRVHRAALWPRLPRPVNKSGGSGISKRLAQLPVGSWPHVIWNCRIYIGFSFN